MAATSEILLQFKNSIEDPMNTLFDWQTQHPSPTLESLW
ncbi:hypothetical protein OROHE_003083 [Orobanche hederae]